MNKSAVTREDNRYGFTNDEFIAIATEEIQKKGCNIDMDSLYWIGSRSDVIFVVDSTEEVGGHKVQVIGGSDKSIDVWIGMTLEIKR